MALRSHSVRENWRELIKSSVSSWHTQSKGNSFTKLHTMAFGMGSCSNSGQGAEEYAHDITDIEDISDLEDYFTDSSAESESEDTVPGAGQRKHGVLDDEARKRRRLANAELDQRFASLRSAIPEARRTDRSSVMIRANKHISKLYKPVNDLKYLIDLASEVNNPPLGNPVLPRASPQGIPFGVQVPRMSSLDDVSHENPMVEVQRNPLRANGELQLNIACINRSALLLDFVRALNLKGLSMLHGVIVCSGNIFFANLSLEEKNLVAPDADSEPRLEPRPEPLPEKEEEEALKETLLRVIRQETPANNSN